MVGDKKMVALDVLETSGVDHPAHMHEGWAVIKAADPTQATAAFAAMGKKENMTGPAKPAATTPAAKALDAAAVTDIVTKAIDAKLQPVLDQIAEAWKGLREYAEAADTEVPSAAPGAEAAPAAAAAGQPVLAAAGADEEMLKALPEPVRIAMEKAAERTAAAEAVAKAATEAAVEATKVAKAERDSRLDQEAIAKAKTDLPNLGLTDEVVKSIRKLSETDPELHKSITEMLVASNAQLDGADIFTELGTARKAAAGSTMETVDNMAKALVADGTHPTLQVAKAAIFESQPELADAIRKEA